MRKSINGFTIVELLIVVVIIGILAAIVVVAYNGITNQAKNSQTLSAVNAWAKAIQLYRADNGSFPTQQSCLGATTTYDGGGYCWEGTYWNVKPNFHNQLAPYISNHPEPDTTSVNSSVPERRGAFYQIVDSNTDHRIRAFFTGTTTCPSSSAGPLISATVQSTTNVYCQYQLD